MLVFAHGVVGAWAAPSARRSFATLRIDDRNGRNRRKARLERCEGKAAKEWYHIAVASAPVAQGIEQLPSKQLAVGSNPTGGANSY